MKASANATDFEVPWLSVVMPVHRGERWLDAALSSIPAADEVGPIEVIIRDSSPDEPCLGQVERHCERLRINYLYVPETKSWTRKTNMAVALARAEHVATLHQDDFWLPGRAARLRKMIAARPDAALYVTAARIADAEGHNLGAWSPPFPPGLQDVATFRDRLLVQNSIAMPSPMWKREAYLRAGGMDENLWYTPDWDLWLKLATQGPIAYEPEATAAFRIHGSSLTMTGERAEMTRELREILKRHGGETMRWRALGEASVKVNTALAAASSGNRTAALHALACIARLGPVGAARYLRFSRLLERVWPRLRMRLKGAL